MEGKACLNQQEPRKCEPFNGLSRLTNEKEYNERAEEEQFSLHKILGLKTSFEIKMKVLSKIADFKTFLK